MDEEDGLFDDALLTLLPIKPQSFSQTLPLSLWVLWIKVCKKKKKEIEREEKGGERQTWREQRQREEEGEWRNEKIERVKIKNGWEDIGKAKSTKRLRERLNGRQLIVAGKKDK